MKGAVPFALEDCGHLGLGLLLGIRAKVYAHIGVLPTKVRGISYIYYQRTFLKFRSHHDEVIPERVAQGGALTFHVPLFGRGFLQSPRRAHFFL